MVGAIKKRLNCELRAEQKKRGLSQNGNKTTLTNRLLSNLQKAIQPEGAPEKVPDGFAPTAKWRQPKPNVTRANTATEYDGANHPRRKRKTLLIGLHLLKCETHKHGRVKIRQGEFQTKSEIR
jgi:hypothetical protein